MKTVFSLCNLLCAASHEQGFTILDTLETGATVTAGPLQPFSKKKKIKWFLDFQKSSQINDQMSRIKYQKVYALSWPLSVDKIVFSQALFTVFVFKVLNKGVKSNV